MRVVFNLVGKSDLVARRSLRVVGVDLVSDETANLVFPGGSAPLSILNINAIPKIVDKPKIAGLQR
jgi:hypothetical protein